MELQISEEKLVNISWGSMVFAAAVIISFSAWMTSIDSSAASAQEMITDLKKENKNSEILLNNIDRRLQRIEVILEEVFLNNNNKEK